jgi:AcrR family transcriptional regulator
VDRTTEPTRARILAAAEKLFAAHGVDGVSLREITRVSGTRNTVGLQYHFKDRNGVLRAIVAKHLVDVDARRHALLDQCQADGGDDLRAMTAALVMPSAAKLSDPDGGPAFLQIYAELLNRPRGEETLAIGEAPASLERWRAQVAPCCTPRRSGCTVDSPRSGWPRPSWGAAPRRGPTPTTASSWATWSTWWPRCWPLRCPRRPSAWPTNAT